ncbi:DUF2007 domain-containing protein [Fuchsiella alkaliacetigena]|uniref:DUF2007 domain-containing protein n=1 Tax=Fuchsiella alkaliacetigena TaxID=957042 RepID=UPI00200A6725|nr:DUF2007 domain-containing protein [Fuchsiella alkaliacetigena]MCK8824229.1 DUF2007 domain-containing protein [Fuchsiella alkaliacetigena]
MTDQVDTSKFIVIYRTQDEYEAQIVRSRLESADFEARIHLDGRAGYGLNIDPTDQIKVLVRASQAKEAIDFLKADDLEN